jgi:hypothetical protein
MRRHVRLSDCHRGKQPADVHHDLTGTNRRQEVAA